MKKIQIITKEGMKILFPLFFALISITNTFAQHKSLDHHMEFGFGGGILNYTGDLSENFNMHSPKGAGSIFYRHSFDNEYISLKISLMSGKVAADEKNIDYPLQQNRKLNFEKTITEIAIIPEYNFFNFRDLTNRYYMSPYLFGGLGVTVVWGGNSPTFVNLPFGIGIKYQISKHCNLGGEFGARKLFSDDLDDMTDESILSSSSKNDWYYFTNIYLSYTFYREHCPREKLKK